MSKTQGGIGHWLLVVGYWSLSFGHSLVIGIWALGLLCFATCANADDSAVLHLTNGSFVPGELKSSEQPSIFRWQSSRFTRPFEFSLSGVNAVQYVIPAKLPKPTGEYCLELAAGDVLFGELLALTDDAAEVEVARLGRLHVKRDQIRRLYRWSSGADLISICDAGIHNGYAGQLTTDR